MNQKFRDLVESLEPEYQALVSMHPVRFGSLPRVMPERGYLPVLRRHPTSLRGAYERHSQTSTKPLPARWHSLHRNVCLPDRAAHDRQNESILLANRGSREANSVGMPSSVQPSRQPRSGSTRWTSASSRKLTLFGNFLEIYVASALQTPSMTSTIISALSNLGSQPSTAGGMMSRRAG